MLKRTAPSEMLPKKLVPLVLLILLFGLPPLLGWIYYLNPHLLPAGHKNYGTLIEPARPVGDLALKTLGGQEFNWRLLADKWTLVVISRGQCGETCKKQVAEISQLRRAQRAGHQRMNLLLLTMTEGSNVQPPVPDLVEKVLIVVTDGKNADQVERLFQLDHVSTNSHFFTIDPLGHLMMRHDTESLTPSQVLADLKTLLAASENWVSDKQHSPAP